MTERGRNLRELVKLLNSFTDEEWEKLDKNLFESEELKQKVSMVLNQIGIKQKFIGYNYIRDAIIWMIKNPGEYSFTQEVYPKIAEKYHTRWKNVERSIRTAVEDVWKNGDKEEYNKIFGYRNEFTKKPYSSDFLLRIVDYMRLYIL